MPIYEKVDRFSLVPGETYRVKHYERELGYLTFNRYEGNRVSDKEHIVGTIPMSTIRIRIFTENHTFSRQISEEEYRAKLKEKYEQTATDTVLKRLIDSNFKIDLI